MTSTKARCVCWGNSTSESTVKIPLATSSSFLNRETKRSPEKYLQKYFWGYSVCLVKTKERTPAGVVLGCRVSSDGAGACPRARWCPGFPWCSRWQSSVVSAVINFLQRQRNKGGKEHVSGGFGRRLGKKGQEEKSNKIRVSLAASTN